MPTPPVREVLFPPDVVEKLWMKHQLSQFQVEQVIFAPDSEARWALDDIHGGRLVVKGATQEAFPRIVFVALRPVDPDFGSWACITAFSPSDQYYSQEAIDEEEG